MIIKIALSSDARLNHRETWNLTVVDSISGNYYPVTSRIYIQVCGVAIKTDTRTQSLVTSTYRFVV